MFKSLTYGCVCLTFVTGCSSSPHSATAVDKRQSFPTRDITPEVIPASTLPPILSTPTPYDPCAAPASRDPSPMSIIFSANWDGDFEIYTIHADGSNLNQLTNNTIDDITPLWSPDGEKIAFVSKVSKNPGRVNVMNSDGTKQMPITNDDFAITTSAWSPDSRNIAFEGVRNGLADFYIVDINNPSPIKVSDSEAYYGLGNLAWSPDSNNLAYDVWLDKHGALRGVILVRLDRLDVQTLMPQPYKESAEIYSDSLPEWDPSNDWIALIAYPLSEFHREQIYLVKQDWSNRQQLTNSDTRKTLVRWSPNGQMLAYGALAYQIDSQGDYKFLDEQIFVTNRDGTSERLVVNGKEVQSDKFSWAPDNLHLAYIASSLDNPDLYDLYYADFCGNGTHLITKNIDNYTSSWKP